jgi:hypothetical protein
VKIIIFNDMVDRLGLNRNAAAAKVAVVVFCILGVTALTGRELLQRLGINLGAFGVGGGSSRAQGTKEAEETPVEEDALIMPFAALGTQTPPRRPPHLLPNLTTLPLSPPSLPALSPLPLSLLSSPHSPKNGGTVALSATNPPQNGAGTDR